MKPTVNSKSSGVPEDSAQERIGGSYNICSNNTALLLKKNYIYLRKDEERKEGRLEGHKIRAKLQSNHRQKVTLLSVCLLSSGPGPCKINLTQRGSLAMQFNKQGDTTGKKNSMLRQKRIPRYLML